MSIRKPKEQDIQRVILDYLKLAGAMAIRVNSGKLYAGKRKSGRKRYVDFNSEPGCADILACLPHPSVRDLAGVFAAIEVKRPGQVPEPHQQSFLDAIAKKGGLALVVTSVNDLAEQLRARGFYAP